MNINLKSKKVTLRTAKKYCPEDITLTATLQDKSVTPGDEQTITADTDYVGLGTVTVAAVETESGAATPSAAAQVITPSEGKLFDKFTVNATPTETKSITPTTSAQTVTPSSGKFLSSVGIGAIQTETKTIDANGTFTPSTGKFFSSVTVNVNEQKPEQEKTISITANGTESVTPDEGYALSKVTVDVNVDTAKPEQTKSVDITSMSPVTVTPDEGKVLTSVTVTPKTPLANTSDATATAADMLNGKTAYVKGSKVTGTISAETEYEHTITGDSVIGVTGKYMSDDITITVPKQTKTVTPKTAAQTITPDDGYAGLSSVTVNAAPLDAAQTVTADTTAKTVSPTGSNIGLASVTINPTPSETKSVTPSTSVQTITPSSGKLLSSVSVAAIATETKSATPTKATQTITPTSGKFLSSVMVNAIPDQYIVPTGSKTITENGTTDVTAVASVTVNIPAPDLSDATATADKILSGVTAYTGAGKITGTIPTYTGLIRPDDPTMPSKGDIITLDSKQYRVLNTSGTVAEVLSMYDANSSIKFDSNSSYNNTYADKNIDTYCNSTFYDGLSSAMKTAIVDKTFTQDSWDRASSVPTKSHYTGEDSDGNLYYLTLSNAAYGTSITRHCYCLSVQDVLDYLEATTSMGTSNTTLTDVNIWEMFWNATSSQSGKYIWLRSTYASYSSYAFCVIGISGSLNGNIVNNTNAARPAFQIDLSKVEWTK